MIDLATPLAGMQKAEAALNRTATRLANTAAPTDSVDLSAETVSMLAASTAFNVNASVLRTEVELSRNVLDLLA